MARTCFIFESFLFFRMVKLHFFSDSLASFPSESFFHNSILWRIFISRASFLPQQICPSRTARKARIYISILYIKYVDLSFLGQSIDFLLWISQKMNEAYTAFQYLSKPYFHQKMLFESIQSTSPALFIYVFFSHYWSTRSLLRITWKGQAFLCLPFVRSLIPISSSLFLFCSCCLFCSSFLFDSFWSFSLIFFIVSAFAFCFLSFFRNILQLPEVMWVFLEIYLYLHLLSFDSMFLLQSMGSKAF